MRAVPGAGRYVRPMTPFVQTLAFGLILTSAPLHAVERCVSPYRGASATHPEEIKQVSGLYEDIWQDQHWLFFTDPCRTKLLWNVICTAGSECTADHAGFRMTIDPTGYARLHRDVPADARLSYLLAGTIADVPKVFDAPVDTFLESYLADGGQLLIETRDEQVEILNLQGFDAILTLLRDLTERHPDDEEPTIMLRYESLHDPLHNDPYVFLPATKPQIQFAIRAQGGAPFRPSTPGQN